MGSVNKVILVGNLGRDAELRYTPGGAPVATLNLATTEVWKHPILRDFALSAPCVTLRHRTRLESFQDTAGGVTAEPSMPAKVCTEKAWPMRSDGTWCDSSA